MKWWLFIINQLGDLPSLTRNIQSKNDQKEDDIEVNLFISFYLNNWW